MALNDVLDEIRAARRTRDAPAAEKSVRKPREPKKDKPLTKAEREAYRARKMKEEEDRYLGKAPKALSRKAKAAPRADLPTPEQVRQAAEIAYANPNPPREPKRPKLLEPLQPLYLLKIPGLQKGDCLAICLVHGVES